MDSVLVWWGCCEKFFGMSGMMRDGQGMMGKMGGKFKFLSIKVSVGVPGMVRIVFWHIGAGEKCVLAWR